MRLMTVGEAAHAAGVSPKAIRLWEARGLIPKAERTNTGYRTFTDADLATLIFIRQAKTLGLTLSEINDVIELQGAGVSPCGRVLEAIDAHLAAINQSIADLLQLRQTLARAKDGADQECSGEGNGSACPIIERAAFDGEQFVCGGHGVSP